MRERVYKSSSFDKIIVKIRQYIIEDFKKRDTDRVFYTLEVHRIYFDDVIPKRYRQNKNFLQSFSRYYLDNEQGVGVLWYFEKFDYFTLSLDIRHLISLGFSPDELE